MQRCLNLRKLQISLFLISKLTILTFLTAVKDMFVHNFLKSKFEYILIFLFLLINSLLNNFFPYLLANFL